MIAIRPDRPHRFAAPLGGHARALALLACCALAACATGPGSRERDAVILYPGFAAAADVDGAPPVADVTGRVVDAPDEAAAELADTRWRNLEQSLGLFDVDECERCPVEARGPAGDVDRAMTDGEGYFDATLDVAGLAPGWRTVRAASGEASGTGELLVVPAADRLGIVSDVDDTVLVSEVSDKVRLLANTFLKNPLQREAVPGVAALYRRALAANPEPGSAAMFYLSASPNELAGPITELLDANGFPKGVLLTKRLTADRARDPLLDQLAYKVARLESVFRALPHVGFVLVGDDVEDDPEAYETMRERHPERVRAIWIRRVRGADEVRLPAGQVGLEDALEGRAPIPGA